MIQNVYRWFENVSISLTQENWEDDPSQALNLYPMRENDSLWQNLFVSNESVKNHDITQFVDQVVG